MELIVRPTGSIYRHRLMKCGAPLLLLLLSMSVGCSRVDNTFAIGDPGGNVTSAELRLCGSQIQLSRSDHQLSGKKRVTCEGEGEILVRLSDGRETSCHIGYVTPGAEQNFAFIVENAQCRAKLQ